MSEISRRRFLQLSAGFGARAIMPFAVGEAALIVLPKVDKVASEMTHHRSGNAGMIDNCTNPECTELNLSNKEKIKAVVVAPLAEEFLFRVIPSYVISLSENSQNTDLEMLIGTGNFSLSRRELFMGIVSSVIFGLSHNLTESHIDTETIPSSQIFMGGVFWYLQRKFGYIANTLTHFWINIRFVTTMTK
jgi:hypothetical protein